MKKFILSAVVAAVAVTTAVAGPKSQGNSGGSHSSPSMSKPSSFNWHSNSNSFKTTSNYHLNFGKSFSHGFFYQGKNHNHWSFNCFWPKYGCQCYWCPSTCGYYYWCEPACCYYPISYITVAPPVQVQVQVSVPVTVVAPPITTPIVQTQVQTQTQTQGAGGPPAGFPGLPK